MIYQDLVFFRDKMKRSYESSKEGANKKPATGFWAAGLTNAMKDKDKIIKEDSTSVIIKDCYPKASHHYLIIPKTEIKNLDALNKTHINTIESMVQLGKQLEGDLAGQGKPITMKMGFHAIPSMTPLHMHLISSDFVSERLKTKKHWNSFTTDFFVPVSSILRQLSIEGKVRIDKEKNNMLLKKDLFCHVCNMKLGNMPKLKQHILKHV